MMVTKNFPHGLPLSRMRHRHRPAAAVSRVSAGRRPVQLTRTTEADEAARLWPLRHAVCADPVRGVLRKERFEKVGAAVGGGSEGRGAPKRAPYISALLQFITVVIAIKRRDSRQSKSSTE